MGWAMCNLLTEKLSSPCQDQNIPVEKECGSMHVSKILVVQSLYGLDYPTLLCAQTVTSLNPPPCRQQTLCWLCVTVYTFIRNTLVCKLLERLFMLPKTQLKSKQWCRSCYRPFHTTLGTRVFETNPDPIAGWYLLTEKLTGSRMKLVWISRNRSKRSLSFLFILFPFRANFTMEPVSFSVSFSVNKYHPDIE